MHLPRKSRQLADKEAGNSGNDVPVVHTLFQRSGSALPVGATSFASQIPKLQVVRCRDVRCLEGCEVP